MLVEVMCCCSVEGKTVMDTLINGWVLYPLTVEGVEAVVRHSRVNGGSLFVYQNIIVTKIEYLGHFFPQEVA